MQAIGVAIATAKLVLELLARSPGLLVVDIVVSGLSPVVTSTVLAVVVFSGGVVDFILAGKENKHEV